MANAVAPKEPTPSQLRYIASIAHEVQRHVQFLEALFGDLEQLKGEGLAVESDSFGEGLNSFEHAERKIRGLRVSGGRAAFAEWWDYRVDGGMSLGELVDWVQFRGPVLAVEQQVTAADQSLIEVLDRAAQKTYIHDEEEYARRAGMTRAEVMDRAEAVITKLIESGWRP